MEYRLLGRTGIKISQLSMGTMSFGGDADEATAAAMFRRCREAGINCFDCANRYADGRAEEILGRLIADCRHEVVLTTKFGHREGRDVNAAGCSRRHIMLAAENSLRRLKTDRIDLYFIHGFDADTPLEETLRALDDLVRHGKALYIGARNLDQLEESLKSLEIKMTPEMRAEISALSHEPPPATDRSEARAG